MKKIVLPLALLLGCIFLVGLRSDPPETHSAVSTEIGIPPQAPDSTIRNHPAGKPFLFMLPRGMRGTPFTRFELVQAPALSWLVERSFYWDTDGADIGSHLLIFRAVRDNDDTVDITVAVEVIAR